MYLFKGPILLSCYIFFCIIYRYAFEPESKFNSVEEFERLQKEMEELEPHKVSDDLELLFLGIPCLADSKTKTIVAMDIAAAAQTK